MLSWASVAESKVKEKERRGSRGHVSEDTIWTEAVTTGFQGGETPLLLKRSTGPPSSQPLFSTKDHTS